MRATLRGPRGRGVKWLESLQRVRWARVRSVEGQGERCHGAPLGARGGRVRTRWSDSNGFNGAGYEATGGRVSHTRGHPMENEGLGTRSHEAGYEPVGVTPTDSRVEGLSRDGAGSKCVGVTPTRSIRQVSGPFPRWFPWLGSPPTPTVLEGASHLPHQISCEPGRERLIGHACPRPTVLPNVPTSGCIMCARSKPALWPRRPVREAT